MSSSSSFSTGPATWWALSKSLLAGWTHFHIVEGCGIRAEEGSCERCFCVVFWPTQTLEDEFNSEAKRWIEYLRSGPIDRFQTAGARQRVSASHDRMKAVRAQSCWGSQGAGSLLCPSHPAPCVEHSMCLLITTNLLSAQDMVACNWKQNSILFKCAPMNPHSYSFFFPGCKLGRSHSFSSQS